MEKSRFSLIGRGLYTLAEAERFTGVPRKSIARWTRGYEYRGPDGRARLSPPIIATWQAESDARVPAIDFADLIEVRFLHAFRAHGVGWKAIRVAAERAKDLLALHHPFSSRAFKTDGKTIMAEIVYGSGDRVLLDLVKNQFAFEKVLAPHLFAGIEFGRSDEPARWRPLGRRRAVVIDPSRAFGAPVVDEGVPTRVIANYTATVRSQRLVAAWFEVSEKSVRDALAFERRHAA